MKPSIHEPNKTSILAIISLKVALLFKLAREPIFRTEITKPLQVMLTNRAETTAKLRRNLQFTVAADAKPSDNTKTPNTNLDGRMVQLIPSRSTDSSTLAQDPDDVAIIPISPVQPTLDATTRITIPACAMATTTVAAQNKA